MNSEDFSHELILRSRGRIANIGMRVNKSNMRKNEENCLFQTNAGSREFKDNFTDLQVDEAIKSTSIIDLKLNNMKEIAVQLEDSSFFKSIKSSKNLYYKMVNEDYHEGEDKSLDFNSSVFRKHSDSHIESYASSLLNFQIKDLEHRTKSNRISSSSHRQIPDFDVCDLTNNIMPTQISQSSYLNIDTCGQMQPGQVYTEKENSLYLNSGGHIQDFILYNNDNTINYKVNNESFTPINKEVNSLNSNQGYSFHDLECNQNNFQKIKNSFFNYEAIKSQNVNCCISTSASTLTNPDIILEKYYYHLRKLRKYYDLYLDNFLDTASKADLPEDSLKNKESLEADNRTNYNNQIGNSTNFSLGFMYGKQGWVCHSCENFNFESKYRQLS